VDFVNPNQLSVKDNYPLPKMEHLLQRVKGFAMFSMPDGFLGYNQILVKKEDQHKRTFATSWGTFEYKRMLLGLLNVGSTFKRTMEFSFRDIMGKTIENYQDDLIMFSKERRMHVKHLRHVFER